jgi:cholesterol transport system auxiliary component
MIVASWLRHSTGLFILMLGGCAFFGGVEPSESYTLEVERVQEQPSAEARERVLEVTPFRITSRYQGQAFVYQGTDARYWTDKRQQFLSPPQWLVTEQTSRYLRHSGLFGAVVEGESRLRVTHLLEGAVTALYGDFSNPADPRAVLEIQFFLIDPRDDTAKVVLQTGFRTEAEIAEAMPQALVRGWESGLESMLNSFESDLRRYFNSPAALE